jgi:hypothetical protein
MFQGLTPDLQTPAHLLEKLRHNRDFDSAHCVECIEERSVDAVRCTGDLTQGGRSFLCNFNVLLSSNHKHDQFSRCQHN